MIVERGNPPAGTRQAVKNILCTQPGHASTPEMKPAQAEPALVSLHQWHTEPWKIYPWITKSWLYLDELSPFIKHITSNNKPTTSKGKIFLAIYCLLNEVQVLEIFAACPAKMTLLIMTSSSIMDVALACHFPTVSFWIFTKAQHGELVCTGKTENIFLLFFFLFLTLEFINVIPYLWFDSAKHYHF